MTRLTSAVKSTRRSPKITHTVLRMNHPRKTLTSAEILHKKALMGTDGPLRMNNMRSLLLAAVLLCVLCAAQVQTQDNTHSLRLCGRAFVRAVVYTCGGSRWKRLMGEEETLQDGSREPRLRSTSVEAMDRHWRDQNQALISACCEVGCRRSDLSMLC